MRESAVQTLRTGSTLDDALADLAAALQADPECNAASLVSILAGHGLLSAGIVPGSGGTGFAFGLPWQRLFDILAGLGGVDLSLARLWEGHVNALQLVHLHGSPRQQRRVADLVLSGHLMGVWGAEGAVPATIEPCGIARWQMRGGKRYASGVGLVHTALVPLSGENGMLLPLVPVADAARADMSGWNHGGMVRSASGAYAMDGIILTEADFVGGLDDYRREPYFVGGIWRCAAAQLGAIESIVDIMRGELVGRGRDAHPLQRQRIGQAAIKARTARLWIMDAAARVEAAGLSGDPGAIAQATALSAYCRLVTEETALAVVDLAQKALGLGSFHRDHPIAVRADDLAVYVRQANPDAVLLEHALAVAESLRA